METTLSKTIFEICRLAGKPLTPQEIRERIKTDYPQFYNTSVHLRNVEKGHYQNVDHALLAQIYITVNSNKRFVRDKSFKPMKIFFNEGGKADKQRNINANLRAYPLQPSNPVDYSKKVRDILENAIRYHEDYYASAIFSGPSLYFHRKAIETCHSPTSLNHIEYVYAALTSWGMHRMGKGGGKMQEFKVFRESIECLSDEFIQAASFDCREMNDSGWDLLKKIFKGINVMATSIRLVGNSKVMHHMLPNLVPPIDREYTLSYLRGSTSIISDLEWEWQVMQELISSFFIPVVSDEEFQKKAKDWLEYQHRFQWDTSIMKIVDNLVIGAKYRTPSLV